MAVNDKWTLAQQSVIGSMLIDTSCIARVMLSLRKEDFTGVMAEAFGAIYELSAEDKPVDAVTVLHKIGDTPANQQCIITAMDMTPTAANVKKYAEICKEQSRLTLLHSAGADLANAVTLEEARDALNTAAAVSLETAARQAIPVSKSITAWWQSLNDGEKPEYINCGIDCLDNTIRTVAGNYHVIAGYPSHGKSAIALQMAYNLAKTKRVGFFAFETSEKEMIERVITHASAVDYAHVQKRELTDDENKAVGKASAEIFERKLYFEPAYGMTVDDIKAQCIRQRYDVIFVDYLQLVSAPMSKYGGRVQAVTEISLGLRTLASQFGIVVYALSQLSRAPKTTGEYIAPPSMSDLRESGQIEQDANAIIMVHAPYKASDPVFRILDIVKNRNGQQRRFFADFVGETQTFREPLPENSYRYRRLMMKQEALADQPKKKYEPNKRKAMSREEDDDE